LTEKCCDESVVHVHVQRVSTPFSTLKQAQSQSRTHRPRQPPSPTHQPTNRHHQPQPTHRSYQRREPLFPVRVLRRDRDPRHLRVWALRTMRFRLPKRLYCNRNTLQKRAWLHGMTTCTWPLLICLTASSQPTCNIYRQYTHTHTQQDAIQPTVNCTWQKRSRAYE
jgi:hypothetical protein